MTTQTMQSLAERLDEASRTARLIPMLTGADFTLTEAQAYEIQSFSIARRQDRGERIVGLKMGLTSRAKMRQMGVESPIYGHLTDAMQVADGGYIDLDRLIHPRIEPELAFILGRDLAGPVTAAEALQAAAWVCPALEIIDSRYENFKFTLPDVVADNASSAFFVLGATLTPAHAVPLDCLGMVLEINGQVVETGSSAAVYDHPARSLAEQANMLARRGDILKAGQIVLSGGATAAVPLPPGAWVRVSVDRLGEACCRTRPGKGA